MDDEKVFGCILVPAFFREARRELRLRENISQLKSSYLFAKHVPVFKKLKIDILYSSPLIQLLGSSTQHIGCVLIELRIG